MSVEGKVTIVTGGGQGIGEAYARAIVAAGGSVAVADLNEEQADRVAKELTAEGGQALAVPVDVADPTSADAAVAQVLDAWGRVDNLVNNAAIYHGMQVESLMKVDLDYYRRFFAVNLDGALVMTRAAHKALAADGGGAIVNQSSTAAWMAGGYYSIAKAALNSLTVNLAAELASQGIRVNAIAPGPTDTAATRSVVPDVFMRPLIDSLMIKRMGQPEDHTGALLFLLSDQASWMTGQIVAVDGGQVVRI